MSEVEGTFKAIVHSLCALFEAGDVIYYPGPTGINLLMRMAGFKRERKLNSINGRELRWRGEVFAERGWVREEGTKRRMWRPA